MSAAAKRRSSTAKSHKTGEVKENMNSPRRPLRTLLSLMVAALAALAVVPAIASAITITVDDDRVQCPLADYTSLPTAVAAAANGDTVHVCAGTYNVPGGPSPSSGLKIEKNLDIEGAGASRVFVQPTPGSGSLAQAAPNPRDEYGNVITVRRRLIELYEVSISGLTVRSGTTNPAATVPVEAGIAMIDVDVGQISGVRVEGIVPATGPGTGAYVPPEPLATQGQGIIVANTIEATDNVTTITGSEIKGFNATGILVDNRLLGGSASVGNDSHMTAKIVNTKITGAGGTPAVAQTGVEGWGSGARIQITKSKISGVGKADSTAAAVALHGVDLANSVIGGSDAEAVNLTGDAYGATNVAYDGSAAATPLNATHDFWGTTVVAEVPLAGPDVEYAPTLLAAPAEPTLAPVVDAPPTIQWDDVPASGAAVEPGKTVHLAVLANDDFGVQQVVFRLGGGTIGVAPTPAVGGERVYQISWTPTAGQAGANLPLSAVAMDSASPNQYTEASVNVNVKGPPRLKGSAGAISGKSGGYALVGQPLSCEAGDASFPAATISYAWSIAGSLIGSGPTYTPVAADQGKRIVCTVTAQNPFGTVSQGGGQVEVAFLPTFGSAAEISGAAGPYALAGETLSCSAAASGEPTPTLSYSWLRDGSPIPGASGTTYLVTAADSGHLVTCSVAATNSGGTATSADALEVGGAPTGGAATIAGLSKVGSTLKCSSGPWSGATGQPRSHLCLASQRRGHRRCRKRHLRDHPRRRRCRDRLPGDRDQRGRLRQGNQRGDNGCRGAAVGDDGAQARQGQGRRGEAGVCQL